jgi:hypothetical protein
MDKLTKMESRAKAACLTFEQNSGGEFSVKWTPSKTWGNTAAAYHYGEKCSLASGCGYDKQSAAIADFLRFLVPDVWSKGGAGFSSCVRVMKENGWTLECTYNGKTEEGYKLTKIN